MTIQKPLKIALIGGLICIISVLHYSAIKGNIGMHILHRELYFIPILLASFWFGLRSGFATAIGVCLIYTPHIFLLRDAHMSFVAVGSQILIFLLVGVLLGWLVDRQRIQQKKLLASENLSVLGRAAAVVGNEMHDLLGALKKMSHKSSKLKCTELDGDFAHEMVRLERMIDVITSFAPSSNMVSTITHDLNVLVRDQLRHHYENASKADIKLEIDLDENRCPSRIDPEKVTWAFNNLIKNAFEVSMPGGVIQIRSHRGGTVCRIEIQDQGPGIRLEHIPKMFSPFFTTKTNGQGLALASSRKVLRDLGGDIEVKSHWGEGATFTMIVPRDETSEFIAEDAIDVATRLKDAS